jgi:peptidoglycan hydrolase-like protein with peptidoglycan-binding domain
VKRPCLLLLPLLAFTLLAPPAAESAAQTAAGKPAVKQGNAASKGKKSSTRRRTGRKKAATRQARGQQQPEPQRIRQIQQALAERGYAVEPTGVWDAATVEALKRFQEDHNIRNLTGRGKLDPLTLIALGLGPPQSRTAPSGTAAAEPPREGNRP